MKRKTHKQTMTATLASRIDGVITEYAKQAHLNGMIAEYDVMVAIKKIYDDYNGVDCKNSKFEIAINRLRKCFDVLRGKA